MCGEKPIWYCSAHPQVGSPPRVRGKVCYLGGGCLGNKNHPRVCGEKAGTSLRSILTRGSPPRVRGKGNFSFPLPFLPGITPACAGKRYASCAADLMGGDHPRVCGEKQSLFVSASSTIGSPPRVRGKVFESAIDDGVILDHPRVCGEKTF